jgi:uncharacterized membrane protein YtjA (UPF0391 family)
VLYFTFLFFSAVVMIAGLVGFGAAAFAAAGIAKFLFFFFLILFLVSLISLWGRGQRISRLADPPEGA